MSSNLTALHDLNAETSCTSVNRDLKIRGQEGQDGNGSGRGKLSQAPSCRQGKNQLRFVFS